MRNLLYFLVAFLLLVPFQAQSQEMRVDTIFIQVYGAPYSLNVDGPRAGYVGDTITLTYFAQDSLGERTPALITFAADPNRATIIETSDSTSQVVLLQPGVLALEATIQKIDSLVVALRGIEEGGFNPPGSFRWARDGLRLEIRKDPDTGDVVWGESAQMCAFLYGGPTIIAASDEICASLADPELSMLSRRYAVASMMGWTGDPTERPYAFVDGRPASLYMAYAVPGRPVRVFI